MDEREILKAQIKAYEFYAGLIERAVGGGAGAKLPRWDEQRAAEYRALAEQLRQQLAELEAQQPPEADEASTDADGQRPGTDDVAATDGVVSVTAPAAESNTTSHA